MSHELLAPAGSLKICKAVLKAGADAVYLGGEKYGARAFAQNFTQADLFEALDFAHTYGKKIHLTVNTLLKNRETGKELFEYIEPYYRHGLDAIIVQDFGVFTFLKENFPNLELHASTQMSIASPSGAKFLENMGAKRVVLARELSLEEIAQIHRESNVDLESFIHGALCYCYSGQCLMSSMLGGRSGNRGRCAQPCRLAYNVVDDTGRVYHKKEKYPISPKDLCTLEILPKLCDAGIYSFKIEGRMKQMEYAAGVTGVYRRYLDLYEQNPSDYQVDSADIDYLMYLGNRNGFTQGYYEMRNGRTMLTLSDSSHSSGQIADFTVPDQLHKIPIIGEVHLIQGKNASLSIEGSGESVFVEGELVTEAQKRPLSESDVREKLSKTGNSPFEFSALNIHMADSCFLPVKQLNELRRNAFEALQLKLFGQTDRSQEALSMKLLSELCRKKGMIDNGDSETTHPGLNVMISEWSQLTEVLPRSSVKRISLDVSAAESGFSVEDYAKQLRAATQQIHEAGKQVAYVFPHVFRLNSYNIYENEIMLSALEEMDVLYVRSYDSLGFVLSHPVISKDKICLDHSLYVYSKETWAAFSLIGLKNYTASMELNRNELCHMPNTFAEITVYGYIPLMVSAQCVYKNFYHCLKESGENKHFVLKDRYFKEFFIKNNCHDCYNIIYNSQPLYLLHQEEQIRDMKFEMHRVVFVQENKLQIRWILDQYEGAFLRHQAAEVPAGKDSYTNGHFRRGID